MGGHSGGNTPTNPTPPDSLTSDDSSYISAKDSNNGSVSRWVIFTIQSS